MELSGYRKARAIGISLLMFGIISLFTSIFFTGTAGPPKVFALEQQPIGELGPLEIPADNTVVNLTIRQPVRQISDERNMFSSNRKLNGWATVECELLDAGKELLLSFSEELWAESGYDEGYWSETKSDYNLKLTIPKKGTYYLGLSIEAADIELSGQATVRVEFMVGSTVPHFAAGFLGILLGLIIFLVARSQLAAHAPNDY